MDYSKFLNKSGTSGTTTQTAQAPQQPQKPTYTEGDKQLVQFFKSKGATPEQTFTILKEAKKKYGSSEAVLKQMEGPITIGGMLVGAGKGALSTLEGGMNVVKSGLNALGVQTASQTAGTDTGEIIPEDWRTPKGASESLGFGAEQIGEFLIPAGGATKLGKLAGGAVKGTGKVAKVAKAGLSVLPESVIFAGQAGMQKGTLKDVIPDAAGAFGFGMALKGIGAVYKSLAGANVAKVRAQIGGASGETLKNMSDEKIGKMVLTKLDAAKKALDDPTTFKNPLQIVGQDELKPALESLIQANSGVGANLASIIKKAKKSYIFTDDAAKSFQKAIEKTGGKITPNGVVFPPTMISKTAKDVEKLNEVWAQISKGTRTSMTPDEVWQLSQSIDDFTRAQNSGTVLKEISNASEIPLIATRDALHNSLIKAVPDSTSLFKQFSEQRGVIDWFNKKLGSNASSASVIKNIFSPLAKDEAVPMFKNLGKMTSKDILLQAKAAKTAMEIVGDTRALGLLEIASNPSKSGFFNAARGLAFNQERAIKALFKALHKTAPKSGSKEMEFLIKEIGKVFGKSAGAGIAEAIAPSR